MNVRYHVISSLRSGWRVKRWGANRASSVHSTQREAFCKARELAQKNFGDVVVHCVDGTVQRRMSFAKDPHTRRGHLKN